MKKILITIMTLFLFGCSASSSYDSNLGVNFKEGSEVIYNIYHSNTENNEWELLKTINIKLEKAMSLKVDLQSNNNVVNIKITENSKLEDKNKVNYSSKILENYKFEIEDYNGDIIGCENYKIDFNKQDEQLYMLYPISNTNETVFFYPLDLNKPYDIDKVNLDNILITITIVK